MTRLKYLAVLTLFLTGGLLTGAVHTGHREYSDPASDSDSRNDAPGGPGLPLQWPPALKQAVGSAYEEKGAQSPVWFTVAEGILGEVFYPRVDLPQIADLRFIVTDGQTFFSEQKRDTLSTVRYLDEGMTVEIQGRDRLGRYSFEQRIVTDPVSPVLRVSMRVSATESRPLRVFVLLNPAINNSGSRTIGYTDGEGLFATDNTETTHIALLSSLGWRTVSAGYVGASGGAEDLSRHFQLTETWTKAGPGNVLLTGEVKWPEYRDSLSFDLALGFGPTRAAATTFAERALSTSFDQTRSAYENGWKSYLKKLESAFDGRLRFIRESQFARRSVQLIKMHEDKTHRGAIVASLSSPAIPDGARTSDGLGGYHLFWPRDAYRAATALLAAGDSETAIDTLQFFARTQKTDGSWPQNSWVDGTPYWHSTLAVQMDEVAFPILLAGKIKEVTSRDLNSDELEMIRKAASFILTHGPKTAKDRWEELSGYSPATLAAEVAALRTASKLTGDPEPARAAEQWQSNIEQWTLVERSTLGNQYYLRTSPNGQPGATEAIFLANGAGQAVAYEIVDGGFLELVRLGVREASDPRILETLRIYEDPARGMARSGSFRRYNRDAYGPFRIGGFWPLLSGERGHYAVASADMTLARASLHVLERSAFSTGLIPEQLIQAPSDLTLSPIEAGLGVASPLVWAHAEDILLHRSIEEGRVFDTPSDRSADFTKRY